MTHRRADVANLLVLAATLAVVGIPVWRRAWAVAQRQAAADPAERASVPRRVFLWLLIGAGAAAALVTAVITVVIVVEAMTTGRLGRLTLHRVRIPAAVLLSTAAIAGQHIRTLLSDRAAEPTRARTPSPRAITPRELRRARERVGPAIGDGRGGRARSRRVGVGRARRR